VTSLSAQKHSYQHGSSFLEALIAMAILSMIVSGVLTAFPRGFHVLRRQSEVGAATYLLRQKVDYYMSQGYNNISGLPISQTEYLLGDGTDSVDAPPTTYAAGYNYVRTVSITYNASLNLDVLTVKIFRRDKNVSPGYDTTNDLPLGQIVTYIGNPGSPPV